MSVSALHEERDFTHKCIAAWMSHGYSSDTCVTPNSSCLSLPFPTLFSLESLTLWATPQPQISPVPPSSPRALQTPQKHFTSLRSDYWVSQEQTQLIMNTFHPYPFPILLSSDGIAPLLQKTCPRSLHQLCLSPPVTAPRPIFVSQLTFQLSLKQVCCTLLQLSSLHLAALPVRCW